MPIEIRELVIKATVTQDSNAGSKVQAAGSNNAVTPGEELVNTCTERMLEILKDKMER